jgi:hypothetical protein
VSFLSAVLQRSIEQLQRSYTICQWEVDNPFIGKLVKFLSLGGVSFHDPDGCEDDLVD